MSARQELIPIDQPGPWRSALSGVEHAFGHTWESCYASSLTTGHQSFLYRFQDGHNQILCPIAVRTNRAGTDILTPFGFSGFVGVGWQEDFSTCWREFARRHGWICGYITLNPLLKSITRWNEDEVYPRNSLYVLDLTLEESELFARLSRSRRRQIRTWEAQGGSFTTDREATASFMIAHSAAFFNARCASSIYNLVPESWRSLVASPNVLPVGAVLGGRIVGVTVFGHSPSLADAIFDVSLPEGRGTAPALIWEGARRLREQGISLLNIGGGVRDNDSVALSKEQYGATLVVPFHCLKQIYDADRFAALCLDVGKNADDKEGYFPAFQAPRLA